MRHYHRMIIRMLPGPMLAWLTMLMFLLVMQFLIRYLPDLVGKGLPFTVFVELISYNLAYMIVLAVPMSVLIASLMSFSKLVETNAYAVIKSSGVSFPQLVWPALVVGLMLTGTMLYFNNEILPEANFRARNLWQDIRVAKPGFDLTAGEFYDGIDQYRILVQEIPPDDPNELRDITIYDYTKGTRFRTEITARRGRIESVASGTAIDLILFKGEIHRRRPPGSGSTDRYERITFDRHRLQISLEDLNFERSDPSRGRRTDRTMRTRVMVRMVDSLDMMVRSEEQLLRESLLSIGTARNIRGPQATIVNDPARSVLRFGNPNLPIRERGLADTQNTYNIALQRVRSERTRIDNARRDIRYASERADRYRVEIHKKYSIALACLIFMLIGAPLGLMIRRGGLTTAAAFAMGIFMFYWITLVNGEKFADRGYLEPWIGMWAGNIVTGLVGLLLALYITFDWRATRMPWAQATTTLSDSKSTAS